MTGFGGASSRDFTVEIRSLNHRFIDISIKMPQFMSQYEIPLRNIIKERFQRGRFDVSVSLTGGKTAQITINKDLARSIYRALRDLQEELSLSGEMGIETLTAYREILMEEEPAYDFEELRTTFNEAASHLEDMRMREGGLLADDIRKRLKLLNDMNDKIKSLAPDEVNRWRERLTERLKLIVEGGMIDNNRIMQEAALMAEKLDISEEITRIENHTKQFAEILNDGNTIGKKIDFLLQEINREVNTLAYKSGDYSISKLVIEMKTEVEKIREQVQNIQ